VAEDPSKRRIVLASASPRRRDLLSELGVAFDVVVPDVDEATIAAGLSPSEAVTALAMAKLEATRLEATKALGERGSEPIVIACDTMVVGADGRPLGKPTDRTEAAQMLRSFSDSTISVVSGLAVSGREIMACEVVETQVALRALSAAEIEAYVATGAADDKAGGLELQGRAASFIVDVAGCWTNVVGLPLCRVRALVDNSGRGNVEAHAGTACGCPLRPHAPVVGVDDLLHDRQAEPGTRS